MSMQRLKGAEERVKELHTLLLQRTHDSEVRAEQRREVKRREDIAEGSFNNTRSHRLLLTHSPIGGTRRGAQAAQGVPEHATGRGRHAPGACLCGRVVLSIQVLCCHVMSCLVDELAIVVYMMMHCFRHETHSVCLSVYTFSCGE